MTLGSIIKSYRTANHMSMDDFSSASGLSKTYISMLEKNKNIKTGKPITPSLSCLRKTAKAMYLSLEELLDMLEEDANSKKLPSITARTVQIPLFEQLTVEAAASPKPNSTDTTKYTDISQSLAHTGTFFGFRITDQSMQPELKCGDTVIVKKQDDAKTGDIVIVFEKQQSAVCTRIMKYADGLRLLPANPACEPRYYSNDELQNNTIKIIGKVVEARRKY